MPVKDPSLYPVNWGEIRTRILARAQHRCEFCDVKNYAQRGDTKIVLTIAQLDQNPANNAENNLRALCQRCHLQHDQTQHQANARETRMARKDAARPLLQEGAR